MKICTNVYLYNDKDCMYELGKEIGLTDEALNEFRHALYEVDIKIEVDSDTGKCKIISIKK